MQSALLSGREGFKTLLRMDGRSRERSTDDDIVDTREQQFTG